MISAQIAPHSVQLPLLMSCTHLRLHFIRLFLSILRTFKIIFHSVPSLVFCVQLTEHSVVFVNILRTFLVSFFSFVSCVRSGFYFIPVVLLIFLAQEDFISFYFLVSISPIFKITLFRLFRSYNALLKITFHSIVLSVSCAHLILHFIWLYHQQFLHFILLFHCILRASKTTFYSVPSLVTCAR